jgi:hypothetical protein
MIGIKRLTELLKEQEAFLRSVQYAYIEILPEGFGQRLSFQDEASAEKFVNSKGEESTQVLIKAFNGKKSLFAATKEYDAIFVYDGVTFSLSQFWKRENKEIEIRPINLENFKEEISEHFSTAKNRKLAS